MGAMAYVQAGQALLGGAGGYSAAKTQRSALESLAWAEDQNARIADWQASQAITNGQTAEGQQRLETAQVTGRERSGLAANGVDLGYGSANDVLASTALLGERDALQIHDNALREAWGYGVQATNARYQAALDRAGAGAINPSMAAFTSLLGSAKASGFNFGSIRMPSSGGGGFSTLMSGSGFAGANPQAGP